MSLPIISKNTLISFIGEIDSNIETDLLAQVEECLNTLKCPAAKQEKIIGITVELLQNILHHASPQPPGDNIIASVFQLEKDKDYYIISASNFMRTKKCAVLQKRIDYLNTLAPLELKNLYQNILDNGQAARETAGLGLIDIRRKSGKPILYKFELPSIRDNNYSLFNVKVLV